VKASRQSLARVAEFWLATRRRASEATIRELIAKSDEVAKAGGTPLAVAKDGRLLGVIHLKDIVKGGIKERLRRVAAHGDQDRVITGDNPLTAAAIARRGRRR